MLGPVLKVLALAGLPLLTLASLDLGYGSDTDLTSFVTRPDIKAPVFDVEVYEAQDVSPGYWFVAPYAYIVQESHPRHYYQPCQTGPAIYDGNGELVWSGACLVNNQNTMDFRVWSSNGSSYLSAILSSYQAIDLVGHAVVLDKSMNIVQRIETPNNLIPFNMHEFLVQDGRTAMHIVQKTELADVAHLEIGIAKAGLVVNMGIREVDLMTGEVVFMWWAHDHIDLSASYYPPKDISGPYPNGWDWIHLNAIDKNSEGDYLVTARYTDAVYKISGKDGHIIWTLGGINSSFRLDGFNFSRPHDARFIDSGAASETISLLDNAGDEHTNISTYSSALVIDLDTSAKSWTARVRQRWIRPDKGRSQKRGNFQLLPNGNAFVGWSENSYISEHSPDGRLLMEARFQSERFVTYRAYKFNFTSLPSEPPELKAFVYGTSPDKSVSVYYVSWNGATEVAAWNFYAGKNEDHSSRLLLGTKERTGFETVWQTDISNDMVYAEAVSANGDVIGRTRVEKVVKPSDWTATRRSLRQEKAGSTAEDSWAKSEL